DFLSYEILNQYPPDAFIANIGGHPYFQWTPDLTAHETDGGNYWVTISVTDNFQGYGYASFLVTVADSNLAPFIYYPGSFNIDEGTTLAFYMSGSDPDGD